MNVKISIYYFDRDPGLPFTSCARREYESKPKTWLGMLDLGAAAGIACLYTGQQ